MSRWRVTLCAVSLALAAVLAIVPNLAVGAIPKSWGWVHNGILLWSVVALAVIASVWVGAIQVRLSSKRSNPGDTAGTYLATVIRAKTVNVGSVISGVFTRKPAGGAGPGDLSGPGDTLPPRSPVFTGRTEVLAKVTRLLADRQAVALRGLAGVGKSHLALEYANQMRASGRYQLVGWVRADSPATIEKGLAALAPLLGLPADGATGEIAAQVVAILRSRRDWLVIFDNAQRPRDLAEAWPGGNGHVLITSRYRVWSGIAAPIDLSGFSRAESVDFLCARSGSDELEAAAALADELDDYPLALAQAAAAIDKQPMTIRGYLELYRDPAEGPALRDAGLDTAEYPASVARTLLLLIRQLGREQPAAEKLLWLFTFLAPGDIDLDLLHVGYAETGKTLARVLANRRERDKAARALAAANLAILGADGHLRVPPLVLAVARDQLNDDQTAKWARRALNLTRAIVPSAPADHRSWPVYAAVTPHIAAVTGPANSKFQSADKVSLLRNLGIYLSASKQPEAARTALEDALAIGRSIDGGSPSDTAKTLDDLAIVHWQRGELDEARASNKQALSDLMKTDGPDDPETARAFGNRGVFQLEMGELEAAKDSFEHALAIFRTASGRSHPDAAGTLMNLSLAQRQLGKLGEAQASIEQALTIFLAAYGSGHPAVAAALVNLGVIRRQSRDFKGAYVAIKQAFDILYETCGPDPHELIKALTNLGLLHRRKITSYLISRALTSRIMRPIPDDQQLKAAA